MHLDAAAVFTWLGPAFVLLGLLRWAQARRLHPQARAWLSVGTIFCVVAWWLSTR